MYYGYVAEFSARALGIIGDAEAVEPLIGKLDNPNVGIRKMSSEALGKIGNARAVESLIRKKSEDTEFDIRSISALALDNIRKRAK